MCPHLHTGELACSGKVVTYPALDFLKAISLPQTTDHEDSLALYIHKKNTQRRRKEKVPSITSWPINVFFQAVLALLLPKEANLPTSINSDKCRIQQINVSTHSLKAPDIQGWQNHMGGH